MGTCWRERKRAPGGSRGGGGGDGSSPMPEFAPVTRLVVPVRSFPLKACSAVEPDPSLPAALRDDAALIATRAPRSGGFFEQPGADGISLPQSKQTSGGQLFGPRTADSGIMSQDR